MRTKKKDQLLNVIHKYYPVGIKPYEEEFLTHASYLRRVAACRSAREDSRVWNKTKDSLRSMLPSEWRVSDYSVLGTTPCYHASFIVPGKERLLFTLFVSVIAPKWAYRFIDLNTKLIRFDTDNEYESSFVDKVAKIVEQEFSGYQLLPAELRQVAAENIFLEDNDSPVIFDSLFDDLET